jgi:hypothetical protein
MNVTPLFHSDQGSGCPSEENLFLFVDMPDTSSEKRAFLNHLSICPGCLRQWEELCATIHAGAVLPALEPDPSIRSSILDAAFASTHITEIPIPIKKKTAASFWQIPGWRFAWAALFLVLSWSVYIQMEMLPSSTVSSLENIESEILTVEKELELLKTDLLLEFEDFTEETT